MAHTGTPCDDPTCKELRLPELSAHNVDDILDRLTDWIEAANDPDSNSDVVLTWGRDLIENIAIDLQPYSWRHNPDI